MAPPRPFTLHVPTGERVIWLVLSPQGDRLAWLFYVRRESRLLRMAQRIFPSMPSAAHRIVELRISRADGTGMHSIGSQELRTIPQPAIDVPRQPLWTPDGKRISFIYHQALYTVPVD